MTDQICTRMTADAFRQLPESTQPTELIDGVVTLSSSPVASHQRLVRRFYALLCDLSPPGEPFDYWMVDPVGRLVEVWQRASEMFTRLAVYNNGDTFSSHALGHEVMLDDIFPGQD